MDSLQDPEIGLDHDLVADVFQGIEGPQMGFQRLVLRLVGVPQAECAEEESRPSQQVGQGQPEGGFLSERIQPRMVHGRPWRILPGGSVHDPVDEVVTPVVIYGGDGPDAAPQVFRAPFQCPELFRFQVRIGPVAAHRVIQVGESGHPIGRVVGGIEPEGIGNLEVGIDTGEKHHAFAVPGIVDGREARRGGKASNRDMVLQEEVQRRTGETADIDAFGAFQPLSQVRTDDPLMPGFRAEGALAQAGFDPEIQVRAGDIGFVVIERILFRSATEQFEAVFPMVPVEGGGEVQRPFPFRPDGREGLQRVFELVVVGRAVEGAGAEVLVAEAHLPAEVAAAEVVRAVPEGLDGGVVAVLAAGSVAAEAIAALITRRNAVETAPVHEFCRCRRAERTEGAALHAGGRGISGGLARDDIDGAQQGRSPIDPGRRPFQHLDALDVADVHGEIEGIVSRLGIGDVDPVQEHGDLVVGAAADADVRLHAHRAPLPHIHAQCVLEQVVDRLGRGRCDGQAVQERDDAGAAMQGHGNARRRDLDAVDGLGPGLGGGGRGRRQESC